jgi:hypothetical protein
MNTPYLIEVAIELVKSGYSYEEDFEVGLGLLHACLTALEPPGGGVAAGTSSSSASGRSSTSA